MNFAEHCKKPLLLVVLKAEDEISELQKDGHTA